MIINGKGIAAELRAQLKKDIAGLGRELTLGFVRSGDDLVAQKFVGMKSKTAAQLGVRVIEVLLSADATTEDAVAAVKEVASKSDGVLVQMPLAKNIDAEQVLASVPLEKDVDAMGERSGSRVLTPVVGAIEEILMRAGSEIKDRRVLIIGAGKLVGGPASAWFASRGAVVQTVTRESTNMEVLAKDAEIIVLGAGRPGMLTPEMVTRGVIILDAGTSEAFGALAGDADPSCAEVASLFTPVPGGIGPVAVAMIFKNLVDLKA